MLDGNKTISQTLLKDMAMKSLVHELKLMTLVMVQVDICAREIACVYCNKATDIDMQSHTVA